MSTPHRNKERGEGRAVGVLRPTSNGELLMCSLRYDQYYGLEH